MRILVRYDTTRSVPFRTAFTRCFPSRAPAGAGFPQACKAHLLGGYGVKRLRDTRALPLRQLVQAAMRHGLRGTAWPRKVRGRRPPWSRFPDRHVPGFPRVCALSIRARGSLVTCNFHSEGASDFWLTSQPTSGRYDMLILSGGRIYNADNDVGHADERRWVVIIMTSV